MKSCASSRRGPAEDWAHIFGGSGGMGTTVSTNCAAVACHSSGQRLRPVHRRASGVCQGTRRYKRPCATTTLIHSASPDSTFRTRLNPVEPPWYETRVPGGVGGAAPNGAPNPDLRPNSARSASRPWQSFQAKWPSLECRRSADCGDAASWQDFCDEPDDGPFLCRKQEPLLSLRQ